MKAFLNLSASEKEYVYSMLKSSEQSNEAQQVQTQWGFLKNIVNIDTFFSSGAVTSSDSSAKKDESSTKSDGSAFKSTFKDLKGESLS